MIQLFSMPSRQYVDETFQANVLLSDWVDISTCGDILIRLQIEAIDPGETVTFSHSIFIDGIYMGGSTNTYIDIGNYQIGFGRGDFNLTTTVDVSLQFVGRIRANATAYSVAKGEDVPIWL